MSKIKTSIEQNDRRYIEEELMRYYFYQEKVKKLKEEIKQKEHERDYELNNPPYGGSFAKVPENNNERDNISMKWAGIIGDLESNLRYYKIQIHRINNWLSILTTAQYNVIMVYVCEYQCQDRNHAALDLKCDSETVKTQKRLALDRIRKKFKEFI